MAHSVLAPTLDIAALGRLRVLGWLAALLLLVVGCGSSDDDQGDNDRDEDGDNHGGGGGTSLHPSYLAGSWDHDEGREGYADYADFSIHLDPSGAFTWQFGPDLLSGAWKLERGTLSLGGQSFPLELSTNCRVMAISGKTYLGGDSRPSSCPTSPAALTPLERCAVGEFSKTTSNGGVDRFTLFEDRTIVEFYDDPGYTSGGASYTRVGEFKLDATNGDILMLTPDGGSEARTSVADLLDHTRKGPALASCDQSGFNKLGLTCTMSCAADRSCSVDDDGAQTCCPQAYPYYCHHLNICFDSAGGHDGWCPTSPYGDPAQGGCLDDQVPTSLAGATGAYCAPRCGADSSCPTGYNGLEGACRIVVAGEAAPTLCALPCTDPGVKGGQCPPPMTCRTVASGNSYCLQ